MGVIRSLQGCEIMMILACGEVLTAEHSCAVIEEQVEKGTLYDQNT